MPKNFPGTQLIISHVVVLLPLLYMFMGLGIVALT